MKTKTLIQTVSFKASPHDIYEMLMDSAKHTKFTGVTANINREVGGTFTAYDGFIEGVNVKLIPDKKIVQKWRGSDWEKGHYSVATFDLKDVDGGTELTFTQEDVPEEHYDHISKGWYDHYWNKIKNTFEK